MIQYLKNREIDLQLWDECISHCSCPMVYGLSWFLNIVSPGWEALIEDDYKSVMPLTNRKKFSFSYLFQPPFTQQLGVFSSTENIEITSFIKAIPSHFRLVEIQLNTSNSCKADKGVEVNQRLTHHLPLNKSAEELQKAYSENTKRNIKKFNASGLEVIQENTFDDLIRLFRENKGAEVKTLNENDYRTLHRLSVEALKRNALFIRKVRNENKELIAGAIFLKSFDSDIFFFSATNDEARNNGAMSAIIDTQIRYRAGSEKFLDFEGSMIPALARFYKSFGSKEIVYLQIRKNTLPPLIRLFK